MSKTPSLMAYQAAQAPAASLVDVAADVPAPARRKIKATEEIIQTSFRLPRSRWKRLHEVAIDERRSVQAIIVDALEQEFARRGLKF